MSRADSHDDKPLDPAQEAIVAKLRRLMLVSGLVTVLGIALVIGVIGYRLFGADGRAAPGEVTALLPKGAEVVSTAVDGNRIAVTIHLDGLTEIRTYDLRTLKPAGRLRFAPEP